MSEEVWKLVEAFPKYEVSNFGNVRNAKTKNTLKLQIIKGYCTISLRRQNELKAGKYSVHRLVATYFIPNPENKPTVNHIDKCRTNNHVRNLEWNTLSEQQIHIHNTKTESIEFGHGYARKIIYRINKHTDEILEEYPSMTLAIKWLYDNKICKFQEFNENTMASVRSRILLQIKGERQSVYGFKWKFRPTNISKCSFAAGRLTL